MLFRNIVPNVAGKIDNRYKSVYTKNKIRRLYEKKMDIENRGCFRRGVFGLRLFRLRLRSFRLFGFGPRFFGKNSRHSHVFAILRAKYLGQRLETLWTQSPTAARKT